MMDGEPVSISLLATGNVTANTEAPRGSFIMLAS